MTIGMAIPSLAWQRTIKHGRLAALTGSLVLFGGSALGVTDTQSANTPPLSPHSCDSVCQLRAQDWAFALLVETYREYRCNQIEDGYGKRTRAVASLANVPAYDGVVHVQLHFVQQLQEILGDIAAAERNRGLQLVHTQVNNLQSMYDCVRKRDEQALGVAVAKTVDSHVIARELKQYLVIQPESLTNTLFRDDARELFVSPKFLTDHDSSQYETKPASTLLYDEPDVPVDRNLLLAPCE